jgi:hypothetical protein
VPAEELASAVASLRELAASGSSAEIRAFLGAFLPEAQMGGGNGGAAARRRIPRDLSLPKSLGTTSPVIPTSFVLAGRGGIRNVAGPPAVGGSLGPAAATAGASG